MEKTRSPWNNQRIRQNVLAHARLRRVTLILSLALIYGAVFVPLHYFWGNGITYVVLVLVALTGWFFGVWAGLWSSLLLLLYNILLMRFSTGFTINSDFGVWALSNLLAGIILGYLFGRMHDMGIARKIKALEAAGGYAGYPELAGTSANFGVSAAGMVNFVPEPTFAIDLEGTIIAWNPAMVALTDKPATEMIAQPSQACGQIFYGHPQPTLADTVIRLEKGEAYPVIEQEYPRLKREGKSLVIEMFMPSFKGKGGYFWAKAAPLFDLDGNLVGAVQTIRDVTEVRLSQERLHLAGDRDEVTGLFSPAYFAQDLARVEHSNDYPVSVVVAGMKLPDGQPGAPDLLRRAAKVFQSAFRASDVVSRTGEWEFSVLLPRADSQAAQRTAERLRKALVLQNLNHNDSDRWVEVVTVTCQEKGLLIETLKQANQVLYERMSLNRPTNSKPADTNNRE